MAARKTITTLGLVLATSGALVLGAAVPASAHTGSLFTVSFANEALQFATISPLDAAVTPFGEEIPVDPAGIEIHDETGYVLYTDGEASALGTWDHTTGAVAEPVPLVGPEDVLFFSVNELDVTPSGTVLTIVGLEIADGEGTVFEVWVASIDPATGQVTLLVDVTTAAEYVDSIATDPATGVTYIFLDDADLGVQFTSVDLAAGTFAPPTPFTSLVDTLGSGYIAAADFDSFGTLWFNYYLGQVSLVSTTGPLGAGVGVVESGPAFDVLDQALAYDPAAAAVLPAAPVLPNMGAEVVGFAGIGAVLLTAGLAGILISRRRLA